jgi:hypothetical protein
MSPTMIFTTRDDSSKSDGAIVNGNVEKIRHSDDRAQLTTHVSPGVDRAPTKTPDPALSRVVSSFQDA